MDKLKRPEFDIVLYTSRKRKKDNRHPIYLRVYYDGQRTFYSLSLGALKGEWHSKKQCFIDDVKYQYENGVIQDWKDDATETLKTLRDKKIDYSPDVFKDIFDSNGKIGSLLNVFEKKMDKLLEKGKVGSRASLKTTYNALKVFLLEKYKTNDIDFSKVDYSFLDKLESWLLSTDRGYHVPGKKPKKFNMNSVAVYMRNIRLIYNEGIKLGSAKMEQYPFGKNKYQIKGEIVKKRALKLHELNAIAEYSVQPDKLNSKLLFLFMAYGNGINPGDLARLRYSQNVGKNEILFIREKTKSSTGAEVKIRRDEVINAILEHFYQEGRDFVFPMLDEGMTDQQIKYRYLRHLRNINSDIKEIAGDAGISNPKEITAYTARHSYAYNEYKLNKDIEAVSRDLGHNDIKITQTYLKSLGAKDEKDNRKRITEFIGSSLMGVNKSV